MVAQVPSSVQDADPLTGARARADYTAAERRFSVLLQERLDELLEGRCNEVVLLRKYPRDPHRLGCLRLPAGVPSGQLRLAVIERLTWDAVSFLRDEPASGGPVSQSVQKDGSVVEHQAFPTKYPHIILCRTDRYTNGAAKPDDITWCAQRVQNQREQTQINRLLDAANLAIEVVRSLR